MSKGNKNTVVVKDGNNNIFQVSIFDERYLNGELVFYRTGAKHHPKTIEKMRKNSFYSNAKPYIMKNGKTKLIKSDEIEKYSDEILAEGLGENTKQKISEWVKETKWIHNISTNQNRRIHKNEPIPEGWKLGRTNGGGWENANSKNKISVIDLISKKYKRIYKSAILKDYEYEFSGVKYENIKIGIVDINTIVVGRENFRKFGIEKIKEIVSLNDFEYKGEKIVRF